MSMNTNGTGGQELRLYRVFCDGVEQWSEEADGGAEAVLRRLVSERPDVQYFCVIELTADVRACYDRLTDQWVV